MKPDKSTFEQLSGFYRNQLLEDIVPFWMEHSLDTKYGGYYSCLDRDGSIYCSDKYAWSQGRIIWTFCKLYNELEKRPEWLEAARLGVQFLRKHFFNRQGRMYYAVTSDGKPLCKPWHIFSETFATIALAEYGKASQEEEAIEMAQDLYWKIIKWIKMPRYLSSQTYAQRGRIQSHATPMIVLAITQELRTAVEDSRFDAIVDECLNKILYHHAQDAHKALFENISANGIFLDSPQGRCINPGHAIESAWFCLHEGQHRNDNRIVNRAITVIDWSLERGWDKDFGGLFYFVDSEQKPPQQLEWDMKLWWPHSEALYALLLAYHLSGKQIYWDWYQKMHDWTFEHFPDPKHGEWFAYLNREGKPSLHLKGNMWKSFFHQPRTMLLSHRLLDKMKEGKE